MRTRSSSARITIDLSGAWSDVLATRIDETIEQLGKDRDVITVAVTGVQVLHDADIPYQATVVPRLSSTGTVIVTVVWREHVPD